MSSFLYPSLGPVAGPEDVGPECIEDVDFEEGDVVDELIATVRETWTEAAAFDRRTLEDNAERLDQAVDIIRRRVADGGTILTMGNGGSASDADRLVRLLAGVAPARSLLDPAVLSALANDVGAARMFARQVETYATARDVVVVFTTSGTSANVIEAVAAARQVGAGTIAFAGYGGAALAGSADVCLRVDSTSVHRIQEAQGTLCDKLVAGLREAFA